MNNKKKSVPSKIVDFLIIVSLVLQILAFIWIAVGSLSYWTTLIQNIKGSGAILFFIGLLIAIINALMDFIEMSIRNLAKTIRRYQ
jgi:uncharacterized membrane protein